LFKKKNKKTEAFYRRKLKEKEKRILYSHFFPLLETMKNFQKTEKKEEKRGAREGGGIFFLKILSLLADHINN
jgi:hypothetical protein